MIGYATAADHGAGCNIHPPDKRAVGQRLGRSALALQYKHTEITWRSPTYARATTIISRMERNVSSSETTTVYDGYDVTVIIEFHDVGEQGLYLLEDPYNNQLDPADFNCTGHAAGTCAWSSLLLNGYGWVDARLDVLDGNKIQMTPVTSSIRSKMMTHSSSYHHNDQLLQNQYGADNAVLATSYGWGSVPMMQIYDVATDLPVLPWNEKILPEKVARNS